MTPSPVVLVVTAFAFGAAAAIAGVLVFDGALRAASRIVKERS